jgi:hypothetical protein
MLMNLVRKIELGSGVMTGLCGVLVASYLLYTDYEARRSLGDEFPVAKALAVALLLFVCPSLMVAIGAYLHAVLRSSLWGRGLIILGSLFLVLLVLSAFITPGYQDITFIWLRLLLTATALISLTLSLIVRSGR